MRANVNLMRCFFNSMLCIISSAVGHLSPHFGQVGSSDGQSLPHAGHWTSKDIRHPYHHLPLQKRGVWRAGSQVTDIYTCRLAHLVISNGELPQMNIPSCRSTSFTLVSSLLMFQTEPVRIACIYWKEKTNDTQSNPWNKTTEVTHRCDLVVAITNIFIALIVL